MSDEAVQAKQLAMAAILVCAEDAVLIPLPVTQLTFQALPSIGAT